MPELLLAVSVPVVITSFSIYTLAIIAIGLYSARYATQSDEDYFLAGRSLSGPIAALSASASSESGWVTLGLVGMGYGVGVQAYWVIPGCLLGYMFNWFVLAGRMSDQARSLNALTLPDFLCFRFRERIPLIRTVAVLVILAAMMAYVAAQMAAAGKAFGVLFDEMRGESAAAMVESPPAGEAAAATVSEDAEPDQSGYRTGVLVGAVIVLLYTVTGGFRAVCWTDFLQALLMVGALVVFPIYLLFTHGGFGFITTQLSGPENAHFFDLTAGKTGFAFLGFLFGSGALGINFGYPGQPHVLVRFMALADRKDARMAGIMAIVWGLLVYWGAVTIGLFACAMHESGEAWTTAIESDRELSLVVSAMYLLPDVVAGLVLAAVSGGDLLHRRQPVGRRREFRRPRFLCPHLRRQIEVDAHADQPAGRAVARSRSGSARVQPKSGGLQIRAAIRLGDARGRIRTAGYSRAPVEAGQLRRLPGRFVDRFWGDDSLATRVRCRGDRGGNLQPARRVCVRIRGEHRVQPVAAGPIR